MRTLAITGFSFLVAATVALGCQSSSTPASKGSNGSGGDTDTSAGGAGGSATTTTSHGGSGTGGQTTSSSTSTTSTGTGGSGGAPGCQDASECPGKDTDCRTRTCTAGVCGETDAPAGTPLSEQTAGDCQKAICDGNGGETSQPDDTDVGDDGKECTTDGCSNGAATNVAAAAGTACSQNGGKHCSASADCVECITGADCASGVCDAPTSKCLAAGCKDGVKNGTETDVDCGGGACDACGPDKACAGDADCKGGSCVSGKCAPTCTDGVKNGAETDVDCGGGACAACTLGQACAAPTDCDTGACSNTCVCPAGLACDHVVLSEIRSRGPGGASDEFVELYNPTSQPVTLDNTWKLEVRSATAASYSTRFTGAGQVIPAHGHFLLNGSAYAGAVTPDAKLSSGITDAASVRLSHGGAVVDAVCYQYNATTLAALTDPAKAYSCRGTPVSNLPHNDGSSVASNSDASLERKPGGAAGNAGDTGDSATDWQSLKPSAPQNTQSAATP